MRCVIDSSARNLDSVSQEAAHNLQRLVRFASLERMKTVAQREDIEDEDQTFLPDRLQVYAHWMAFILLAGDGGKIMFKAHFTSTDIQSLVARALRKDIDRVNRQLISDFMREYCNLTAGVIKARLLDVGVHTGLSIPIVTRGFDEIWRVDRELSTELFSYASWKLKWPSGSVVCTMGTRADAWPSAAHIKDLNDHSGQESDLEFL